MSKYKVIDAFCGAGGLSLGLKNAGFEIVLSFDLDNKAIETIKQNAPEHKSIVCDVKSIRDHTEFKALSLKKGSLIFWLAALHAKVLVFNALLVAITMTVIY